MTPERGLLERADIYLDPRHSSDAVGMRALLGEMRDALDNAALLDAARVREFREEQAARLAAERELDEARYDWNLCSESLSETKYRLGIAEQRIEALEGALREIRDLVRHRRDVERIARAALAESGGG